MANTLHRITNANVYVDGVNFAGRAAEIELPAVKSKMETQDSLGMNAEIELPIGLEKLEMMIKWNSLYPQLLLKAADNTTAVSLQVRSSIDVWEGGSVQSRLPVKAFITGTCKDLPGGSFAQNTNVDIETNWNVTRYRLEIDGQRIVEVDTLNNIHFVGGRDILAQYRINLGL